MKYKNKDVLTSQIGKDKIIDVFEQYKHNNITNQMMIDITNEESEEGEAEEQVEYGLQQAIDEIKNLKTNIKFEVNGNNVFVIGTTPGVSKDFVNWAGLSNPLILIPVQIFYEQRKNRKHQKEGVIFTPIADYCTIKHINLNGCGINDPYRCLYLEPGRQSTEGYKYKFKWGQRIQCVFKGQDGEPVKNIETNIQLDNNSINVLAAVGSNNLNKRYTDMAFVIGLVNQQKIVALSYYANVLHVDRSLFELYQYNANTNTITQRIEELNYPHDFKETGLTSTLTSTNVPSISFKNGYYVNNTNNSVKIIQRQKDGDVSTIIGANSSIPVNTTSNYSNALIISDGHTIQIKYVEGQTIE